MTTLPPSVGRMSENVGASTSRNPKGLHGLYGDNFTYFYLVSIFTPDCAASHAVRTRSLIVMALLAEQYFDHVTGSLLRSVSRERNIHFAPPLSGVFFPTVTINVYRILYKLIR
jgi:hypothetical protein